MKKVLLIIVDACASQVLIPAMQQGKLPNMQALASAGILNPACTAVFPSVTPVATASLITGQYPNQHGILGFHWYDLGKNEVIYYGDDFWVVWNKGFGQFLEDFLLKLNSQQLQADTLFQIVEAADLKSASLNYLVFRGDVPHKVDMPLLLNLVPGISDSMTVYGPSLLYFGDLVDTEVEFVGETLTSTGGPLHRFGFNDENTGQLLVQLAKKRAFPECTVAYFPDNDFNSHKAGPENALSSLEQVDAYLGDFFAAYGGLDHVLADMCILLTGDHSQSDMVADETRAGIRLDELLADFTQAKPGAAWHDEEQLLICPDMRTAQIYLQPSTFQYQKSIVEQLLSDERVDQVMWRADRFSDGAGYHLATSRRGRLHFWPGTTGEHTGPDKYGNEWSWQGDLAVVSGSIDHGQLTFPHYPNAFERIVGGLAAQNSGHIWVTAQPGYEFQLAETNIHTGGGSHGSLHLLDSTSPLIVAGAPENIEMPSHPRSVDITPLCLSMLGFDARPWINK